MTEPLKHLLHRKAVESGLLGIGGAGKARVLMYHGIGEEGCHRVNVRHLSSVLFDRQVQLFKAHFHVVPLEDLFVGARHPKRLTVAITFDDGLRTNLTHALPVLEKHKVPASFFITGANALGLRVLWGDLLDLAERHTDRELRIDARTWKPNRAGRYAENGNGPLLRDRIKELGTWAPKKELYDQLAGLLDGPMAKDALYWQLLSDPELQRMAAHPLVTLGAHGWWHNDMGNIPLDAARTELELSKEYLERLTGRPVRQLAWPDGSYSKETIAIAAQLGFTVQLAVDHRPGTDRNDPRVRDRYGLYDFPVRDRWLLHLVAEGAK